VLFDDDRREFRIEFGQYSVTIKVFQISWTAAAMDKGVPVLFFSLASPAALERLIFGQLPMSRTRISCFDADHERIIPYSSLAIRLVCTVPMYMESFQSLCRIAKIQPAFDHVPSMEFRDLFSQQVVASFHAWLKLLSFEVAFQVEAITRALYLDLKDMMSCRDVITELSVDPGEKYLCGLLRYFSGQLKDAIHSGEMTEPPLQFFQRCRKEYIHEPITLPQLVLDDSFDCLHVSYTPTTMHLDGPFPERSNRVFRQYPDKHDCFIRVTFVDETHLQMRFDREVSSADDYWTMC
jgi:RNA-dependent RNA polymerase